MMDTATRGIELRKLLDETSFEAQSFLYTAIALAEMVHSMHKRDTIIRDLNPEGILIRRGSNTAVLLEDRKPNYAYLSPEQTGRMNLVPDARSDLYALGVIYYEMLAGCLPFLAQSAEDWLHALMAILPTPLRELRPELDGILGDIVMKLLAKAPEERYQSVYGLLADLKQCASSLEEAGSIAVFEIAVTDDASRFRRPRVLFGREAEEKELWDAYESALAGESVSVLVSGRSGSGKTALIRELRLPVMRGGGRFIEGKCDSLNHDTPFAPILQALRSLVRQIWRESPEQIVELKRLLANALGQGAGVIAELLPEAATLLGDFPPIEPLPPAEAVTRFRWLFPAFIKVFAGSGHPLVMFLDDLQWADPATLDVLHELVQDSNLHGLFIICAYRDETETGWGESGTIQAAAASWIEQATSLQGDGTYRKISHISLGLLSFTQVIRFVSFVLGGDMDRSRKLAELIYKKTSGNPLYLHRFLDSLYREKKLYYDTDQSLWMWDADAIKEMPDDHNVLHLIGARLQELSLETIQLLGIAGAIGHRFRPSTIALVSELTLQEVLKLLNPVVEEGLLVSEASPNTERVEDYSYRFMHDRVQQAAYEAVTKTDKAGLHLRIGRILRLQDELAQEENSLFDTVHHLNLGSSEMKDEAERRALAEYNLRVALKSKASTAYAVAQHFLETGLFLLGDNEEQNDSLQYRLLLELSECEYVCGRADRAEKMLEQLLNRTVDPIKRSGIYLIRISMNAYLKRDSIAVDIGVLALGELGWDISAKPSKAVIAREMVRTYWALHHKGAELSHLPLNSDPVHQALSDLVMAIAASAFIANHDLAALLYSKFVRYGLKHGNNEAFAFILSAYAIFLSFALKHYSVGFRLTEIAYRLSADFESTVIKCRLHFVMGLIGQYRSPDEAVGHFEKSARYGLESGDLTFAGFSIATRILNHTGDLHSLSACVSYYEDISRQFLDEVTLNLLRIARRYVAELQGEADEIDETNDMNKDLLNLTQENQFYYACTCKIQIAYLMGSYREALEWTKRIRFKASTQPPYQIHRQRFYKSLSQAVLYNEASWKERQGIRASLVRQLRYIKEWPGGSGRVSSAYLLIKAELTRIKSSRMAAAEAYEKALSAARAEEDVLMEALVGERLSACYRASGLITAADAILANACSAYGRWGAGAKVRLLREQYPGLYAFPAAEATAGHESWERLPTLSDADEWVAEAGDNSGDDDEREYMLFRDIDETVMRQAAGWPGGGSLTDRFLESALRYVGAEKGYVLIGVDEEAYPIEAAVGGGTANQAEEASFASSVVRYVVRTGEAVVLTDAASRGPYRADPYIRESLPRSILCMMLPYPGRGLPSVLYLENNLASGVFTKERLDVLDMLFSRMVYLESLKISRSEAKGSDDSFNNSREQQPATPRSSQLMMFDSLTNREMEILHTLSSGLSNKEIALHFGLTEGTVKNHVFNLYSKLGVKRRVQAIARARELGLLN